MYLTAIFWCWGAFAVFWILNLFANKRTLQSQSAGSRVVQTIPFGLGFWLLLGEHRHLTLGVGVFPFSLERQVTGLVFNILGLCVAIWARVMLGKNWSGTVTYKQNHELITRGPYVYVRHPIYSGMLLMFLGTALAMGRLSGFVGFAFIFLSLWLKYRMEEALMREHFGEQYRAYMHRVRAVIPYVF